MKNILDLVYDYSKKRKYLDFDAIKEIIKLYKKVYDVDVKNLIYDSRFRILFNNWSNATYKDKEINVFYGNILFDIEKEGYKSIFEEEDKLNYFEKFFRINIFILKIIFHELEHATHDMITTREPKNLEEKLIKIECNFLDHLGERVFDISNYNEEENAYYGTIMDKIRYIIAEHFDFKLYDSNYDISLIERLADIDSMTKIYNMTDEIKGEIPVLYNLMAKILLSRKFRNYDESFISPTVEFFKNITGERQFYFPNYIDMSLDERLRLGLPISTKENEEISMKLKH